MSEIQALPSSEITTYQAFEEIKKEMQKADETRLKQVKTGLTLGNLDRLAIKNG